MQSYGACRTFSFYTFANGCQDYFSANQYKLNMSRLHLALIVSWQIWFQNLTAAMSVFSQIQISNCGCHVHFEASLSHAWPLKKCLMSLSCLDLIFTGSLSNLWCNYIQSYLRPWQTLKMLVQLNIHTANTHRHTCLSA